MKISSLMAETKELTSKGLERVGARSTGGSQGCRRRIPRAELSATQMRKDLTSSDAVLAAAGHCIRELFTQQWNVSFYKLYS